MQFITKSTTWVKKQLAIKALASGRLTRVVWLSIDFGIRYNVQYNTASVTLNTTLYKRDKFAWHFVCLPFVRINSARQFSCALCLQNLESYFFLIAPSFLGPETWRQANSHIEQGDSRSSFRPRRREKPVWCLSYNASNILLMLRNICRMHLYYLWLFREFDLI
jgi:hypothetical protein